MDLANVDIPPTSEILVESPADSLILSDSVDTIHTEQFHKPFKVDSVILHRVKIRSLNAKQCQRFLPSGIKTGWFGIHTVPTDATTVVITEGEFDAMAVYQATGIFYIP